MKFRFCGDLDCPDWVLAEIATLSKMSSIRLKVIVIQILNYCINGTFNYDKVLKLASDNTDGLADIKGVIAAIHFMITNAAKFNVDENSLILEIQQLGLPKENTEAIAKQYKDTKDILRSKLAENSYRISKLVNVDWRFDHILATSSSSSLAATTLNEESEIPITGPILHINLKVNKQCDSIESQSTSIINNHSLKSNEIIDKYQNIAFDITPNKLDVLIYELSQAQKLMNN